MYRNKKDIDKHVESLLNKITPKEFCSRAYSVARLYYEVGDYVNCKKYVEQYLGAKDNNAAAHKLLAQCYVKLGQKEKAFEEFRRSLDLDASQTNIILDICQLLIDEEMFGNSGRAKYWLEKAEENYPRSHITVNLREKLLTTENSNPEELIDLLKSELSICPKDVTLHARLLKIFINNNKIKEGFEHSLKVEFLEKMFENSLNWYETLTELLKHNSLTMNDWQVQLMLLTVAERLLLLSLNETPNGFSKSINESVELLEKYDEALKKVGSTTSQPIEFYAALMEHHKAQFSFHSATLMLKKANKGQLSWSDAISAAAPLMLISWHTIPVDANVNWLKHSSEVHKSAIQRWYLEGSYRCSQAGHYLLSNVRNNSQSFLDSVAQFCSASDWTKKIAEKVVTNNVKLSYFTSNSFSTPLYRLPTFEDVKAYDVDSQLYHPNSLHNFVWILRNYKNFADFKCSTFDSLKIKSSNYQNCGPETLNKLDVFAFLYCAAFTAQQNKNTVSLCHDKPEVLPANITDLLCTFAQMKWWDCTYKLCQNCLGSELTDIRSTLSRGIEVVRCIDSHGLDPELLCKVAKVFVATSKQLNGDEFDKFEGRAHLYYSSALVLLEKLKNGYQIRIPEKRLFDYTNKALSNKKLDELIEEAKLFIAISEIKNCQYDKAVELLTDIKTPEAYYHLGVVYKTLAFECCVGADSRAKFMSLLSKAKKYFYQSFDKIKELQQETTNPLFTKIQEIIETIETHINNEEIYVANNDTEVKYSSDEAANEFSPYHASSKYISLSSTPKHHANNNATNYKTAVDSQLFDQTRVELKALDQIENQIKKLQKKDSVVTNFIEQTKHWFEENRDLGKNISLINEYIQKNNDQFKEMKISVDKVKEQIDECRNECKDVTELKKQVAELRNEVKTIKKPSEQTINESDLYSLDEDFRNESQTSNFTQQLPFNPAHVIPQLNQRLVPPFNVPANPYQIYGQNLYNFYNQFAQFPQTPSIPTMAAPPLFDAARQQMNYPGIFPTAEQIYAEMSHFMPPSAAAVPPVSTLPVKPMPPISHPMQVPATPMVSVAPSTASSHLVTSKANVPIASKDAMRPLPVNVVITSSDPLPTCTSTPQPVLSVTIPPKHIKGLPHSYQITMPNSNDSVAISVNSSVYSSPIISSTQPSMNWNNLNKTTNATPATYISETQSIFGTPKINQQIDLSSINQNDTSNTSLNKSRTLSERSNTSTDNYDPCPDFKPIVPLPAEVKVTTGEEDELTIFSARAKLFRFVDKQWKERGLGEIKLLKHKNTQKVRVLMRREQIHKVCANHLITQEMEIKPMKNETKAYFWVANDFADETVVVEKFCARFKTADIAKTFYDIFEKSRLETPKSNTPVKDPNLSEENSLKINNQDSVSQSNQEPKNVLGGFTFANTPNFKVKNEEPPKVTSNDSEKSKPNIFGTFSFKSNTSSPFNNIAGTNIMTNVKKPDESEKLNNSDTVDEFEPSVEFKPVVPLPALVEIKTGEEDEIILFEHRAKLLRFITASKEWKERGLGTMKLLVHKDNSSKLRLLMRREQVMKVCCNHSVTNDIKFQKMPSMEKAVTWCAKDFSEGELIPETFCLRFKSIQACDDFLSAVTTAQANIKDSSKAEKEEKNAAKQNNKEIGFGDQFKPKPGSWLCDACYTNNLETFLQCACCEQPKPGCNPPPKASLNLETGSKFTFGIPKQTETSIKESIKPATPVATLTAWGDKFKPKEGSWECKQCLVRNDGNKDQCCACQSYKNPDVVVSKTTNPSIFGDTTATKFSFGIPPAQNTPDVTAKVDAKVAPTFNFSTNNSASPFFGVANTTGAIFASPKKPEESKIPINLSMNKSITITPTQKAPQKEDTLVTEKSGKFEFVFKPKNKSPVKSPRSDQEEESDNEYVAEEDNDTHFSPVVPLPDKVDVITGEENEIVLYNHRAKLFRFVDKEWKERGLGNIKILKNKDTGKLRVLMRREQVLKICLNHILTPDIEYSPKDEKSWCFAANDFSEGDIVCELFCIRFQNKDVALQFKKAIDNARSGNSMASSDDDVIFVSETQSSNVEKQRAKELMLPDNFFNYKNKAACEGCRGCDSGDENNTSTPPAAAAPPFQFKTPAFQSPSTSIFETPALNKSSNTSIFGTPLGGNGSSGEKTLINPDIKGNIFGNTLTFGTPTESSASNNKGSILAAPKLNSINTSNSEEPQKADPKTIFGMAQSKFSFGNTQSTDSKPNESIFGGTGFGASSTNLTLNAKFTPPTASEEKAPEVKSLFGPSSDSKNDNIFGSAAQGSIFGPASLNTNKTGLFGGKPSNNSIFGMKTSVEAATPVFGSETQEQTWTFGSKVEPKKEDDKTEDKTTNLFKVDDSLSFASMSSMKPAFSTQNKADFKWEGAGQPLVSLAKASDKSLNKSSEDKNDASAADEEYDPHYEPIVPLPDKINVLTGEEDEERLFCQRCKLYRFDSNTREWKERGVGELKILYHPERKTYRLLLRREQVHKAVLNMLLFMDFELLPMKNSDRAWTMAGQNFAENASGEYETLTVRFKTIDLAQAFHDRVVECVRKIQAQAAQEIREKAEVNTSTNKVSQMRLPKHMQEMDRGDQKLVASLQPQTTFVPEEAKSPTEVKPLRLPKHLGDSSRADNSLAMSVANGNRAQPNDARPQPNDFRAQSNDFQAQSNGDAALTKSPEGEHDTEDHEDYQDYEHNYEDEDYEGYYNEYESGVYYSCAAAGTFRAGATTSSCGAVHAQVLFDPDVYSPKIVVTDPATGELLADMLIHTDTEFEMSGESCSWSGVDYTSNEPVDKSVTLTFPDADTAMQFYDSCETSKAATYASADPES